MKTPGPRCEAPANLTVQQHDSIRRELLSGLVTDHDYDEIDLEVDPLVLQRPPQRRSGKETCRVLSILDEISEKGREG
jgi:hypothetical protein